MSHVRPLPLLGFVIGIQLLLAAGPAGAAAQDTTLSSTRMQRDVKVLASDKLGGRGLGTPQLEKAGDYIAQQLKKAGLKPGGLDGTYFQPFDISTEVQLGEPNQLNIAVGSSTLTAQLNNDFRPLGFSDSGSIEGELVYAGYGISAPELSYNDYAGLDVRGKVVIVLQGLPGGKPSGTLQVPGGERFGQLRYKALVAREKGASAVLFVDREGDGELLNLPHGQVVSSAGLVALHVKRRFIDEVLEKAGSGQSLASLQATTDQRFIPDSKELSGIKGTLTATVVKQPGRARNVVARLDGSDPQLSKEVVVIGAHYDHLGLGGESSLAPEKYGQIHHGADDNASGTSMLIELARYFQKRGPLPRTLLFVAFSAEEAGLGGSSYYVRQPIVPVENTACMINLDMVGRLRDGSLMVQGVDTAEGFRSLLVRQVEKSGLKAGYSGDGYGASDHSPFYARQVPVLFFFTGAHADYHRPSDTADRINYEGMVQVAGLVSAVVEELASAPVRPRYIAQSSGPAPEPGAGGSRGYGAYLGTIPDFTDGVKGVVLTGVRQGSPAEKAGLQAGDVIIGLGGQGIQNLQDYTYALKAHKAGETVEIRIRRGSEEKVLTATLGTRP